MWRKVHPQQFRWICAWLRPGILVEAGRCGPLPGAPGSSKAKRHHSGSKEGATETTWESNRPKNKGPLWWAETPPAVHNKNTNKQKNSQRQRTAPWLPTWTGKIGKLEIQKSWKSSKPSERARSQTRQLKFQLSAMTAKKQQPNKQTWMPMVCHQTFLNIRFVQQLSTKAQNRKPWSAWARSLLPDAASCQQQR